jgi:PhoPQ-activated pathogenicity-related protein
VPTDRLFALLLAAGAAGLGLAQPPKPDTVPAPPPDLAAYVTKPDPSFAWKRVDLTETIDNGAVYTLDLTSQTWHGVVWQHKLQVFVPKGGRRDGTMVLWNQGGTPNAGSHILGQKLAELIGAPVAFLYGVPNQPLFGGKREDALIAETFVRYLDTKDSSWPLLFPMVKSVVKAMDALQAFAREEWKAEVKDFVVTGASKRGWTSWLTAASGEKRVKAIAPLVIDTLNFPVQMRNQAAAFGRPSEMVHDYVERKLIPIPDTPEAKKLWLMIDPWVYRDRLTMPKMIINGANDPYWPLDALNSYWDDLPGEKYALYVPNAGHDLRETTPGGIKELIPVRAVNTLAAFCRSQITGKPMPRMTWVCTEADGGCRLTVETKAAVKGVRVWRAESATRDFRKARWAEQPPAAVVAGPLAVAAPARGYSAFYAEYEFEQDGRPFTLCTQVRILKAKK